MRANTSPLDTAFLFDDFRLDRRGLGRKREGGQWTPIALGSRAIGVLTALVERSGEIVTRQQLMEAVWPNVSVEDSNLAVQVSTLRRVLDRGGSEESRIQTVIGRGYRFLPVVAEEMRCPASVSNGPIPAPAARPRRSIMVLPFANLSNDREQQYFADGITEDLTADLSRLANMMVISCNTAFTYRNKRIDTKQIGDEVGVCYVLEGSIRRSGGRVRVNAQLIDATTDAHLWAERFEGDTGDLLALQDEITSRIAVALELELIEAEARRVTENPDALDCIFQARAALSKPSSHFTYIEGIRLLERAIALDPRSHEAQSLLASVLASRVLDGLTGSPGTDIALAETLVEQALATSPRDPLAHYARGQVFRAQNRNEEAILEFERAIALNRNWPVAYAQLGRCKFYTGSIEEMVPLVKRAIRLSPRDGEIGQWFFRIGVAHLVQSRIDEAIVWLEKARGAMPAHPLPHAHLASAYALKGDIELAFQELADARRLSADNRYSSIVLLRAAGYFGVPKVRALYENTYFTGLRMAGVREE